MRLKPSIALIMFGTNDIDVQINDLQGVHQFRATLTNLIQVTIAAGPIPVLNTIPPRKDNPSRNTQVEAYNQAILDIGREYKIPVINYWRALTAPGMINAGLSKDGKHPSPYGDCKPNCKSTVLTEQALRYGYNQRNLITLQTLAKLKAIVIENGVPDRTN
jgi:lysophospholipase L1-like esterase